MLIIFKNPNKIGVEEDEWYSFHRFEFLDHPLKSEFEGKENASKYLKESEQSGNISWEIESLKVVPIE